MFAIDASISYAPLHTFEWHLDWFHKHADVTLVVFFSVILPSYGESPARAYLDPENKKKPIPNFDNLELYSHLDLQVIHIFRP